MTKGISVTENYFWLIFHQLKDLMPKCEDRVLREFGITSQQFSVLLAMASISEVQDDPIIITSLVPVQNRSLASMSSIIDRMENIGIVEKIWDLKDRRAVRLKITPKGGKILRLTSQVDTNLNKRLLANFSADELQMFISLIRKLRNNMYEESGIEIIDERNELNLHRKFTNFLNKLNASQQKKS